MIGMIYSPNWFYGSDIVIDIISIIVLFLIASFTARSYKIRQNTNYLNLSIAFFVLALSFFFKILMNYNIYYSLIDIKKVGSIAYTYQSFEVFNWFFTLSYLLYLFFAILGFYALYHIYNHQSRSTHILVTYLTFALVFFVWRFYYFFHLTILVLLALIIYNFIKYLTWRYPSTYLLLSCYIIIAISQISFMLIEYSNNFYVIGEFIQLMGYVGILITFILVLIYGGKKN